MALDAWRQQIVRALAELKQHWDGRRNLRSSRYFRGTHESSHLAVRHPQHPAPLRFETPSGIFVVPSDADTDLIVHTIARGAVFEEEVVDVASALLIRGQTVLDVGANFGQMTVLFARAVGPTGRVVAFEADRYIADLLRLNIALNGLSNVDVVEGAVWSESGLSLHYPEPDLRRFGTYGAYGIDPQATMGRTITSVTVDSLGLVEPISFMKVDIQGSDLFGLRGAIETIRRHRMPIVFEYEPLLQEQFGTVLSDYMAFVDQVGYRVEKVIAETNYLIVPRTGRETPPAGTPRP